MEFAMPDANLFVEKRAYPRYTATLTTKYRVIEDEQEIKSILERRNQKQNTSTQDISLGGMYLVAKEKLNSKSILSVEIILPRSSTSISVFAEVVWSNNEGVGVRFITIKEEDLETLKNYLEKLATT
jgi:c-di-GMP-binding flagellar brake protein YcgR